jgi:energy-converting hydrogenase A subunit M
MPVQVQPDSLKHMRDVHHPIATTLDDFELVIDAFHKPTCGPVKKGVCSVVEPVLSRGQKALKATSLTRSDLVHPLAKVAASPVCCSAE